MRNSTDRSLEGLVGTPPHKPRRPAHATVPRTERALGAEGGAPAPGQEGGPCPHLRSPGEGGGAAAGGGGPLSS